MKALRAAALGLAVVVCLIAAAPAVSAGEVRQAESGDGRGVAAWIGEWVERVAGWFGWGEGGGEVTGGAGAVTAAAGGCTDETGKPVPCPTPSTDHGSCTDPNGVPCKP